MSEVESNDTVWYITFVPSPHIFWLFQWQKNAYLSSIIITPMGFEQKQLHRHARHIALPPSLPAFHKAFRSWKEFSRWTFCPFFAGQCAKLFMLGWPSDPKDRKPRIGSVGLYIRININTLINISPLFYCLLPILYGKSTMRKQIQRAAPIWRKLSKQLRSFSPSLSF